MMKTINYLKILTTIVLTSFFLSDCSVKTGNNSDLPMSPNAKMKEINWADVSWTKGFWADKSELCRKEIIPAVYKGLMSPENSEHLDNLKIAAGLQEGEYSGREWSDGDCYKWIESMAYMYAMTKDPELDRMMDKWIEIISKAQQPDGYISTNMTLLDRTPYMQHPNPNTYGGAYHEMYNEGHLLTAACTHYRATGKKNFLNVAIKLADHLEKVLKPGAKELRVVSGNLPTIMGLVDMYRVTGRKAYLKAAQVQVDLRGNLPNKSDLMQDHVPFREETEAVGHSVFATYLYAGVADLVAETSEQSLWTSLDQIWQSAALRRTYITGGACAIPKGKSARGDNVHEAFGADYQLPNRTAYNETCANIGNAMWNWRMLFLTGDAKYTDIVETVIYNTMLSSVSIDGRNFFYANPLEWNFNTEGQTRNFTPQRWPVHGCYCCPPQVARTIAGLGKWAYSVSNDTLWVHLFGGNKLQTRMPDGSTLALEQESLYPWEGDVKITLSEVSKKSMSVMLRIPGWVEGPSLKINQQSFEGILKSGSYVALSRKWSAGDVIELNLPMPVRLMEANPKVEDDQNSVAVVRGPVVYCAEFPKSENGEKTWNDGICLPENVVLTPKMEKDKFGGVVVLEGKALTAKGREQFVKKNLPEAAPMQSGGWDDLLYRKLTPRELKAPETGTFDVTLIPYYAWANRGPAYMRVWIPLAR
jgi:uncharacterized protein